MTANPLLEMQGLPPFAQIRPEQIVPAIKQVLTENRHQIHLITHQSDEMTWDNFIHPLNEINDRLNRIWSPIHHLHGVADSEELRTAYSTCLSLLSDYRSEIGHNKLIYNGYKTIANSPQYHDLTVAQQKVIQNELRDFHLSGIDLPPEEQARYKEIRQRLSQLSSQFSENVLDATQAWKKHITNERLLAGLPESVLALLRQNAEQEGLDGWLLTLDAPCYLPLLTGITTRNVSGLYDSRF